MQPHAHLPKIFQVRGVVLHHHLIAPVDLLQRTIQQVYGILWFDCNSLDHPIALLFAERTVQVKFGLLQVNQPEFEIIRRITVNQRCERGMLKDGLPIARGPGYQEMHALI